MSNSKNSRISFSIIPACLNLFKYAEVYGNVYLPCFLREIPFLVKFDLKNVCWRWKLVVRLIRTCWFWPIGAEISFFSNFGPKNQNGLSTRFSLLNRKYLFWPNLVQKFKIICFIWNLVSGLIWISWI